MNGAEYRKALTRLKLSPPDAARFLNVNDTTSRRWITNRHPIPHSVTMLLRVMIKHELTSNDVLALLKDKELTLDNVVALYKTGAEK
jgi:DNA-binding transcriptional regulator YiaG